MAVKRYELNYANAYALVDIDDEKCTEKLLHELNDFWWDAGEVLDHAGGNITKAVLTRLCTKLMIMSVHHFDAMERMLTGREDGWPPLDGSYGITLVQMDDFEFELDEVTVLEVGA